MTDKVTILGAGSAVFSLGLVKDLCLTRALNGSHVCLMNINKDVLDVICELGRRYAEDLTARRRHHEALKNPCSGLASGGG